MVFYWHPHTGADFLSAGDADLASKDTDIDNLERETKSLIKSNAKFEGEVQELRKQLNNTSAMAADGEKSLQEKTSMIRI